MRDRIVDGDRTAQPVRLAMAHPDLRTVKAVACLEGPLVERRIGEGRLGRVDALELTPSEAMWLRRFDGSQSLAHMLGEWDTEERELISVVFILRLIGALDLV